ncbi:MAG: response regulator, partial [Chloroflexota bacterium]
MASTILVIDDERNMRWVLEQALEKAGYDVVTAEDGQSGLLAFARNAVDLVLLDLKMPGQDGLSVLRTLRQRSAGVPMILMTAYATVPTAIEALKIGATDYIRKPFDLETVLTKVHDAIVKSVDQPDAQPSTTQPIRTGYAGGFDDFIGTSLVLLTPLEQAAAAVYTKCPVSIYGEQGTGRR